MIGLLIAALVVVIFVVIIVKMLAKAGINGTVSMAVYAIGALIVLWLLLQMVGVVPSVWGPGVVG